MNEKGKNTIAVILIIIFLGVIGYCGYLVVDKLNSKETNNKQTNIEENKDDNVVTVETKRIAEDLMEKFHGGIESADIELNEKLVGEDYIDYNKLPNESKYTFILTIPKVEATRFGTDFYATGYDKKTYDEEYHKLYGYDKEIKFPNLNDAYEPTENPVVTLFSDNNNYYNTGIDFGGIGGYTDIEYKIIDIKKQNDTMQIYIKSMPVVTINDGSVTLYSEFTYGKDNTSRILEKFTTDLNNQIDYDKYIDKYSDQLNTYKWTFKYDKEHGNYYFYSVEKVK